MQVARSHDVGEDAAARRSRPGKKQAPSKKSDGGSTSDGSDGDRRLLLCPGLRGARPLAHWAHTVATFHDIRHMRVAPGGRRLDTGVLGDVVWHLGCTCSSVALMRARPADLGASPFLFARLVAGLPPAAVWCARRLGAAGAMYFGLTAFGRLWKLLALLLFGVVAPPLMDAPERAKSLREFWSKRWDTTIQCLLHRCVYVPLAPPSADAGDAAKTRRVLAVWATFAASGAMHCYPLLVAHSFSAFAWWQCARMASYFAVQGGLCFVEARGWVARVSPWIAALGLSPLFTAAIVDLL